MTSHDGLNSAHWDKTYDLHERASCASDTLISNEEAANWAMMLAGTLSQAQETPQLSGFRPNSPEPDLAKESLWRDTSSRSQAGLTQPAAPVASSQRSDTQGVNEPRNQRIVLNVDSETLGRVQLIVDREEGGVRVLVGSDPEAKGRLSEGKHTLGEALSVAGVRVNSLRFVTQNEVGTVLAQQRLNKRARDESEDADESKSHANKSHKARKKRNLNLVG